jgi:undecaprenyl-diphosphatase
MSDLQAIFFAIIQGVTELFPVSSLGHAVVLPALLHWPVNQHAPDFLPFLVTLHVGTAGALLIYFWRDWIDLLLAFIGRGAAKARERDRRLFWLLVVATLPAVVVGFAFEKWFQNLFGTPLIAAVFLIANGGVLFVGERLRRRASDRRLDSLGWKTALAVGVCQCGALIPGISRSGATIVGGLLAGLRHADAARFSFLMATPIILGAAVLEVPKLLHEQDGAAGLSGLSIVAGLVSGVTAYTSVALLMRYFKRHDFEALDPFAYYCLAAGALALVRLLAA